MKKLSLAVGFMLLAGVAGADELYKQKICPSASVSTAIGTASVSRIELCLANPDPDKTVCISAATSFTCDGTVGTDGWPISPRTGICNPPIGDQVPANGNIYCRSATSDTKIGYKETRK